MKTRNGTAVRFLRTGLHENLNRAKGKSSMSLMKAKESRINVDEDDDYFLSCLFTRHLIFCPPIIHSQLALQVLLWLAAIILKKRNPTKG